MKLTLQQILVHIREAEYDYHALRETQKELDRLLNQAWGRVSHWRGKRVSYLRDRHKKK